MGGHIELVLEGVPDEAVGKLTRDLIEGAAALDISHSDLGRLEPEQLHGDLVELLQARDGPAAVFVRPDFASVGGVGIRRPLIRILRVEGSNDVELVFGSGDIELAVGSSFERLAAVAGALAVEAGAADYYCGYEPATDERTRLFSKNKPGPLV